MHHGAFAPGIRAVSSHRIISRSGYTLPPPLPLPPVRGLCRNRAAVKLILRLFIAREAPLKGSVRGLSSVCLTRGRPVAREQ